MPHHFETIKAQLAGDVASAIEPYGVDPKVYFGRPRKPIRTYPHAVVRTVVEREVEGRSVEETYGFEIDLRLPLPNSAETDIESRVFGAAGALIARLAPCDPDDVPEAQGPYAGVGYLPQVTSVVPGEETDSDAFCSVKIGFSVRATVYQ